MSDPSPLSFRPFFLFDCPKMASRLLAEGIFLKIVLFEMAPSRMVNYDIAPLQRLLQRSSAAITQRYIGIEPQRIEKAIEGHAELL